MYINEINLNKIIEKISLDDNYIFQLINDLCDLSEKTEPFVKSLIPEENRRKRLISEAETLIKKYKNHKKKPKLFGIPVGIKDIFSVDGFETKCGSNLPAELFQTEEAESVSLLKKNGALIFGKTVTTEFAYFEPNETRNPHNLECTPGGSSSGSAAAVACGIVPISLGTQTIGSITRPAAYCGIFGYKPTLKRISTKGVFPFSPFADHVGIFAQDIESLKLTASIICKRWKKNNFDESENNLTIGAIDGEYIEQADKEIVEFYYKKISELEKKGFNVKRIELFPDIEKINVMHRIVISSEFTVSHHKIMPDYKDLYRQASIDLYEEGENNTIGEFMASKYYGGYYRNEVEEIKKDNNIDIFISPSTLNFAPKGMATGSPLMNLPWTYIGVPTINVPFGFSEEKLPFGLQFSGSFGKDEKLFADVEKIIQQKNI